MFLKRVNNQVEVYGQLYEMEVTEGTQPKFKRADSKVITKRYLPKAGLFFNELDHYYNMCS